MQVTVGQGPHVSIGLPWAGVEADGLPKDVVLPCANRQLVRGWWGPIPVPDVLDRQTSLWTRECPATLTLIVDAGDYTMKAITDGETEPGQWVISDGWELLSHTLLSSLLCALSLAFTGDPPAPVHWCSHQPDVEEQPSLFQDMEKSFTSHLPPFVHCSSPNHPSPITLLPLPIAPCPCRRKDFST